MKGNYEKKCSKCGQLYISKGKRPGMCMQCLEAENERLNGALDMIMMAAGAPDPAGALHTVIEIARKAKQRVE